MTILALDIETANFSHEIGGWKNTHLFEPPTGEFPKGFGELPKGSLPKGSSAGDGLVGVCDEVPKGSATIAVFVKEAVFIIITLSDDK